MTAHLHAEHVEGCYRCETSADEVARIIRAAVESKHLVAADDVEGLRAALNKLGALEQVGWAHGGPEQFGLKSDDDGGLIAILGVERDDGKESAFYQLDETMYYTVPLYRFKGEQT